MAGAHYAPRYPAGYPDDGEPYSYGLRVERQTDGSLVSPYIFLFDMYGRHGGKLLSTLRLAYICGNGDQLCEASADFQQGRLDPWSLTTPVVELTPQFRPSITDDAPYAMIFPDFVQLSAWSLLSMEAGVSNMTFYATPHVYPRLDGAYVWIRTRCGGD